MLQELNAEMVIPAPRKNPTSFGSSRNGSQLSYPLHRLSLHPSVTWGGTESGGDVVPKQQTPTASPPMKLPGLLSKAGMVCSSHKHLMRFSEVYDEARCRQLEEQINFDHLQKLQRMFQEANEDGGGLDMDAFRKAMKKILGDLSDEDIDVIFMKVDANCDGSVDWEEYLNYMLREYRGKDDMLKSKMLPEFQATMKHIPVSHSEEIVGIQFFPNQSRGLLERSRTPSGRYLTVSRDGILHYWSDSFKMLRTVYLDQTKRRHSFKLWVIEMMCLPNINLLAVSTTDQDIEFFDIGGNKCDRLFSLVDLDGCATAMDYWTDGCKGVFCVGDLKGNVLIFTSSDVITNGLFNIRSYIGGLSRVPVHALMKGKTQTTLYRNFTMSALHGDWCQQIKYIPQLNLVASCTPADKSAMALTSLPLHYVGKIQAALIVLRKGILCFDYSPEMNILATGGYEPLVRIWNPYVTNSPITQMKGHSTAVTHIMINGQRSTIVSISKDKNIRVWDLLDHFCLQSIHGRNVPLGIRPISSVYYHQSHNILICATYTLGLFIGSEYTESELKTQEEPLCCMLYNKIFKQAVSGSYGGMICVWDIMTGQKIMEFPTSPESEQPVEIAAMIFDPPERRLITALKNGVIRLWNFNNGACLMELPFDEKTEINCVFYMSRKIFVAGSSRRVTWYLDSKDENKVIERKNWKSYHREDILCMDGHSNKLLATSSSNGDIVLWYIGSGQAFCRFNASQSPLLLLPKREFFLGTEPRGPGGDPKKVEGCQGQKKCWAYQRTTLPSQSTLPLRPSSARISSTPSRACKRPSSAVAGSETLPPQASWDSKGTMKRGKSSLSSANVKDPFQKEASSWKEEVRASQVTVEKILFLKTRERKPNAAILLSSCMDGYLYAWAVGSRGGLLGKFRAAHNTIRDSVVTTMSADDKDLILFTGDSLGYIKIWDIMNYCIGEEAESSKLDLTGESPPGKNPFRDLIPDYCRIPSCFPDGGEIEQVKDGWLTSLIPPVCLSSWRGHLRNVVSIRYVERFHAVLTAGQDNTIKLWMLTGRFIGTFGQSLWQLEMAHLMPTEIPEEIRRVASLHTLRVLHEGRRPHWESTRKIVQSLSDERKQHSLIDLLSSKSSLTNESVVKMHDMIQKETRMAHYTEEQVEETFQKWQESGKKSDILGHAYKPKGWYPMLKQLPEMKATVSSKEQPRIYRCIQYTELHPLLQPVKPDCLVDSQAQLQGDQRGLRRGKKWKALTGALFKTSVKRAVTRRDAIS